MYLQCMYLYYIILYYIYRIVYIYIFDADRLHMDGYIFFYRSVIHTLIQMQYTCMLPL